MRSISMKIFLTLALIAQMILLSWAKYFSSLADAVLKTAVAEPKVDVLEMLDQFQHYTDLDNYLGYLSAAIWVVVAIIVYKKELSKTSFAHLIVYLPILFNFVLSFV